MRSVVLVGFLLYSMNTLACWRLLGTLSFNKNKVEINQKVDHDKTYSFQNGPYLFHLQVNGQNNTQKVSVKIQEKKGLNLLDVSNGLIIIKDNQEATLTKTDEKTGDITTLQVKISEI